MKLVFAGTPEFAATALAAIVEAGHDVVLVLTQPDRPSGRGMRIHASPVKALASRHGIEVLQPHGLKLGGRYAADAAAAHDRLRATPHDAMVVAAYGLILPQSVLDLPPSGCINIHASLLPRWRGAAPIQRAIEAGDAETGVTIMQMDAGLDTGPMLSKRSLPIEATDSAATLTARLALLGGIAVVDALRSIADGTAVAEPQPEASATYAAKVTKDEGRLDFAAPSRVLVDRIRAFDPWPGSGAALHGDTGEHAFKVWRAERLPSHVVSSLTTGRDEKRDPGRILACIDRAAVVVETGDGAIALTELQKPGGKRLPALAFARDFGPGSRFVA